MKTTTAASIFSAGVLIFGLGTSCLAAGIPESVDINLQTANPALQAAHKDSKTVPGFSHAKHIAAMAAGPNDNSVCTTCHAGVATAEDIGTPAAKQRQVEAVEAAGGVKNYMHGLCLDCHKNMKKDGIATGPTTCAGCHNPR